MAYVYQHIRLDTNEVFYVGISNESNFNRATNISRRTKLWKNVFKKAGRKVEIIANNISLEEAIKLEKELIQKYGRRDLKTGTLVNLTDGGEGNFNHIVLKETREKISKTLKERNIKTTPKLTPTQVVEICNHIMTGKRQKEICNMYSILTKSMFYSIYYKQSWKEITLNFNFPNLKRK